MGARYLDPYRLSVTGLLGGRYRATGEGDRHRAGRTVLQCQAIEIGALRGRQEGRCQSRDNWRHRERPLLSTNSFLGGAPPPRNGYYHRCPGHQGSVVVRRVRLVVSRPTALPGTHPFVVVRRAEIDYRILGDGGERVRHPEILKNIPHRYTLSLVCDPVGLIVIIIYGHYVEGVGGRFCIFRVDGRFCGGGASSGGGAKICAHGGNMAADHPHLMSAMATASCSAQVMVNRMSLKAESGCDPCGSGEYTWGKVGYHTSFILRPL